jgi:Icc-related predicted phosphoesterase
VKLLLLTDFHGQLPDPRRLPKADLALIGGDLTPLGATSRLNMTGLQAQWVREQMSPWVAQLARRMPVIGIAGNHDFLATYPWGERLLASMDWTYLRDASCEVRIGQRTLKVFGSPWTPRHPRYPNWAFQAEDEQLPRHWRKIPRDIDILLVHGPPRGSPDLTHHGTRAGSVTLAQWLKRTHELTGKRPLVACGHLHETPGLDESAQVALGAITHDGGSRPRDRVLVLDGNPGSWKARWHAVDLGSDAIWFDNASVDEHLANLKAERLPV